MVTGPGLALPCYLHPLADPLLWERLRRGDLGLEFAVVNVHNGVGAVEPAYARALRPPLATPLAGYVDTAYARRATTEVTREAAIWGERYDITRIFLDQFSVEESDRTAMLGLIENLRQVGVSQVIANPGRPAPAWLGAAVPVICELELDWDAYQGLTWPQELPPRVHRSWHLIHSVPVDLHQTARDLAAARGADLVWVTSGLPPTPWQVIEPVEPVPGPW